MGVERRVRFPDATAPEWPAIAGQLVQAGETPVLRMIDGLPAFPDEVPEENWTELRVGLAGGMVTLRRQGGDFVCVTWGAADGGLVRSWDVLTWAAAAAGGGTIVEPGGETWSAGEFRQARLARPG